MKKSKILLPLALVGMLFSLAACNAPVKSKKEEQSTPTQESQPAEESKPAETSAKEEKITITAEGGKTKLILGETVKLTASVEGVTWESKNPEVASVSDKGLVTSLKEGSTSISASKDGYKTGSITIKVELEKITITAADNKTELLACQTVQLTASQQGVTWASSDDTIATVKDGLVTAVKFGDATITASKEGYKEASIVIHVIRPEANANFDLTVAADHYSADGWWELPSVGGFGFAMQTVTGWNPLTVPFSYGEQTEEPDPFLGGFGEGDKETVKFTSDKAIKAEIVVDAGNSDEIVVSQVMAVKLNDKVVDLGETALPAHPAQYGNQLEFGELSLGELDLVAGENTLEFSFLAATNLFLNEVTLYAGDAKIALVAPAVKEQIKVEAEKLTVIEGETVQIVSAVEGISYVSVNEETATVNESGLVTGVKMGKVDITVKKDGMYSVRVEITVNPKPVEGQILLEAEKAEELKDIEPGSFAQGQPMINQDGGQWGGSAVHSGGAYVSMWGGDSLTLTFKFEATEAKTMVLSVVGNAPASWGGEASPLVFKDSATVTFNDVAMEFTDQAFPAASGMNPEMSEVVLGDVNVIAGENTLVVVFSGSIPSLDVFKLSVKA